MNKLYILNYIHYVVNFIIIIIWVYLYSIGSLTLNRIIIFIIVFLMIYVYSRGSLLIYNIFLNKKVKKHVEKHKEFYLKVTYILLYLYRWINPVIVFLAYTDKWLYRINRYITSTSLVHYNFFIYLLMKYYVMFGLIKWIVHKYYNFWLNLNNKTIIEILFKRMYGLILSILIFTDILNNVMELLSQYSVLIYVLIYYVISTFCVIIELLNYYYYNNFQKWILSLLHLKLLKKIFNYLNIFELYKYFLAFVLTVIGKLGESFEKFTKMHVIMFLRSQFSLLGRIITDLLDILVPKESNFKERLLYVQKFSETSFFGGPNIAYYIPVENFISLKYFEYFGYFSGLICLRNFESTFELFWKSYIYKLSYNRFFKLKCEIKYKPSIFLYITLKDLAGLYNVHNQPINRFMDWLYFEIKYKKSSNILNEDEKSIVNRNLSYLKRVDDLRARLMFFIIWDIEYFYNNNKKHYSWNYWILQLNYVLDVLIFMKDQNQIDALELNLLVNKNNNKILKFYDPEENMEFLNRLFNVLGIVNILYYLDNEEIMKNMDEAPYYVSKKFVKYNEKYEGLVRIMYAHDFNRWEENQCECSFISNYEVEIAYKTEEYFQNLRREWENSIKTEKLEERNWRLLKRLEDLMISLD